MCLSLSCPKGIIPSLHEGSFSNAILCKIKCLVSTEFQGLSSLSVGYRFPGVERRGRCCAVIYVGEGSPAGGAKPQSCVPRTTLS